jgi:hypothetical protein
VLGLGLCETGNYYTGWVTGGVAGTPRGLGRRAAMGDDADEKVNWTAAVSRGRDGMAVIQYCMWADAGCPANTVLRV